MEHQGDVLAEESRRGRGGGGGGKVRIRKKERNKERERERGERDSYSPCSSAEETSAPKPPLETISDCVPSASVSRWMRAPPMAYQKYRIVIILVQHLYDIVMISVKILCNIWYNIT